MKIECLIIGDYQTNCYIVRKSDDTQECLLIDTAIEAEPILAYFSGHKAKPIAVVLTHGHADHIIGLAELRKNYPDIKVYIHKLDAEMLTGSPNNLSAMTGLETFSTEPADTLLADGDTVEQAGIKLAVLHTPGHSPGGICLYSENEGIVFVGDTLFAGSVGRTDFPNGNMSQLTRSIKQKLFTLPDETVCYPGHGMRTTIAREKNHNPFLQ